MKHNNPIQNPYEIPAPDQEQLAGPMPITGSKAVGAHNEAVYAELRTDQLEDMIDQAKDIQASKVSLRGLSFVRRTAHKLRGTAMTREEEQFVHYAHGKTWEARTNGDSVELLKKSRGRALDNTRHRIRGMKRDTVGFDEIESELDKSAPGFLQKAKAKEKTTWHSWLADTASDEQLLNFLQWHAATLEQKNADPEVQKQIHAHKQQYKGRLKEGLDEGWAGEKVHDAIAQVDDVPVYIGDKIDLNIQRSEGYHDWGDNFIIVGDTQNSAVMSHELNHPFFKWGPRWRNEALTQHTALILEHGEPDVMFPNSRKVRDSHYADEILLYNYVLRGGQHAIPPSRAIKAFTGTSEDRRGLEADVDASWSDILPEGVSVFPALDAYIAKKEAEIRTEKRLKAGMTVEMQAVDEACQAMMRSPQAIFGNKTKQAYEPIEAPRPAIFNSIKTTKLFESLVNTLVKGSVSKDRGATSSTSQPRPRQKNERSNYSPTVEATVTQDISELRGQGLDNKRIYRKLAARYHPDTNSDTGDSLKLGYVSQWYDKLAKEEAHKK
jgi:hypothetical protein